MMTTESCAASKSGVTRSLILWSRCIKRPFLYLTLMMFILLLALPLVRHSFFGQALMSLLFLDALLVGIFAAGKVHRAWVWIFIALWVFYTGLDWAQTTVLGPDAIFWTSFISETSLGFLIVGCLWLLLRYVFSVKKVSADSIFAALAAYLLLAFLWSVAYRLIALFDMAAFSGLENIATEAARRTLGLLYYSLVTITTLGYGDITPVSLMARMLAAVEAVAGSFYMAVLIAWLMGLYLRDGKGCKGDESGEAEAEPRE